ncbi:MAG: hypothetical protein K6G85_05845 [Eubacterium sp.]|nr:hypothetical protein [Eubacterium sp.]
MPTSQNNIYCVMPLHPNDKHLITKGDFYYTLYYNRNNSHNNRAGKYVTRNFSNETLTIKFKVKRSSGKKSIKICEQLEHYYPVKSTDYKGIVSAMGQAIVCLVNKDALGLIYTFSTGKYTQKDVKSEFSGNNKPVKFTDLGKA